MGVTVKVLWEELVWLGVRPVPSAQCEILLGPALRLPDRSRG